MNEIKNLTTLLSLIQSRTGLAFAEYQYASISKILRQRMNHSRLGVGEYVAYLKSNSRAALREWEGLLHLLTIGKTFWFRNRENFETLSRYIVPAISEKKNEIRILSIGCSTGEEPYSLMIELLESRIAGDMKIFLIASDIDIYALETARRGIYSAEEVADIPAQIRKRYFTNINDEMVQVKPELRSKITFRYHNLCSSCYPEPTGGLWDVIFCRNVLIYFSKRAKSKALERILSILDPEGYLFLGYSESLFQIYAPCLLLKLGRSYCYQKSPSDILPIVKTPVLPRFSAKRQKPPTSPCIESVEPVHLSTHVQVSTDGLAEQLSRGNHYLSNGNYCQALETYENVMRKHPLIAEPYILTGISLCCISQWEMAILAFKKGIYLEPNWAIAHFYLSFLYEKNGQLRQASLHLRQAEKILATKDGERFISDIEAMEDFLLPRRQLQKTIECKALIKSI